MDALNIKLLELKEGRTYVLLFDPREINPRQLMEIKLGIDCNIACIPSLDPQNVRLEEVLDPKRLRYTSAD